MYTTSSKVKEFPPIIKLNKGQSHESSNLHFFSPNRTKLVTY